jgi:hypothetical protein
LVIVAVWAGPPLTLYSTRWLAVTVRLTAIIGFDVTRSVRLRPVSSASPIATAQTCRGSMASTPSRIGASS